MAEAEITHEDRIRWAIEQLDCYVELCDRRRTAWYSDGDWQGFDDQLNEQIAVIARLFATYWPGQELKTSPGDLSLFGAAGGFRSAVVRRRAMLSRRDELQAYLKPAGPQISAAALHPWVWAAAEPFWSSKHYRQAVGNAAALNANLQTKLGRRDVTDTALVKEAFAQNAPVEGKPRLRFLDTPPRERRLEFAASRRPPLWAGLFHGQTEHRRARRARRGVRTAGRARTTGVAVHPGPLGG